MNATITHKGPCGATATLDIGQPHPNATFEVQLHELDNPGIASRVEIGTRVYVKPGKRGVEYSLDWIAVDPGFAADVLANGTPEAKALVGKILAD